MEKKLYMGEDANLDMIADKTVAVVGYGTQGTSQAFNMRDSGLKVIVGANKDSEDWQRAKNDGFEVLTIEEVATEAQIFNLQISDMAYKLADTYNNIIKPKHDDGDMICLSSAFNFYYNHIIPPQGIDAIVAAPKGPGSAVRKEYEKGKGVPGLLAIHQDATGKAKERGLAICKAVGFTRVGVQETTVEEETVTDLLGEHCAWGAITALLRTVYEVMVEEGYDPNIAFYEAINESKLTTDLIYKFGIAGMLKRISVTAAYGAVTVGPGIIDDVVKERIRTALYNIKDGTFDRDWKKDYENNYSKFNKLLKEIETSQAEIVGNKIRQKMGVLNKDDFEVKNI